MCSGARSGARGAGLCSTHRYEGRRAWRASTLLPGTPQGPRPRAAPAQAAGALAEALPELAGRARRAAADAVAAVSELPGRLADVAAALPCPPDPSAAPAAADLAAALAPHLDAAHELARPAHPACRRRQLPVSTLNTLLGRACARRARRGLRGRLRAAGAGRAAAGCGGGGRGLRRRAAGAGGHRGGRGGRAAGGAPPRSPLTARRPCTCLQQQPGDSEHTQASEAATCTAQEYGGAAAPGRASGASGGPITATPPATAAGASLSQGPPSSAAGPADAEPDADADGGGAAAERRAPSPLAAAPAGASPGADAAAAAGGARAGEPSRHAGRRARDRRAHARAVLARFWAKLDGAADGAGRGGGAPLTPAEQVDLLLRQATSTDALARMYEGWTPWL